MYILSLGWSFTTDIIKGIKDLASIFDNLLSLGKFSPDYICVFVTDLISYTNAA